MSQPPVGFHRRGGIVIVAEPLSVLARSRQTRATCSPTATRP